MRSVLRPDPVLLFVVGTIAATMGMTAAYGLMFDKVRVAAPAMTTAERCAIEYDRGTEQERKDCVLARTLGAALERDVQEHRRLQAIR